MIPPPSPTDHSQQQPGSGNLMTGGSSLLHGRGSFSIGGGSGGGGGGIPVPRHSFSSTSGGGMDVGSFVGSVGNGSVPASSSLASYMDLVQNTPRTLAQQGFGLALSPVRQHQKHCTPSVAAASAQRNSLGIAQCIVVVIRLLLLLLCCCAG